MSWCSFFTKENYQHAKEAIVIVTMGAISEGVFLALKYLHAEHASEKQEEILFAAIPVATMALAIAGFGYKHWRDEQLNPYQPVHPDPIYHDVYSGL